MFIHDLDLRTLLLVLTNLNYWMDYYKIVDDVEAILEFHIFISETQHLIMHLCFLKQIMVSIDLRSLIYVSADIWKLVIAIISHNANYITFSSNKPSRNSSVKCFFAMITTLLAGVKIKFIVQILANSTYYTIFASIYIFFISEWTDTLKRYAKDIQEIEVKKTYAEDKHKQTDMCIVQD